MAEIGKISGVLRITVVICVIVAGLSYWFADRTKDDPDLRKSAQPNKPESPKSVQPQKPIEVPGTEAQPNKSEIPKEPSISVPPQKPIKVPGTEAQPNKSETVLSVSVKNQPAQLPAPQVFQDKSTPVPPFLLEVGKQYAEFYRELSLLASGKKKREDFMLKVTQLRLGCDQEFDITMEDLERNSFYPEPFRSKIALELFEGFRFDMNPKQKQQAESDRLKFRDENLFPLFSLEIIPLVDPNTEHFSYLKDEAKSLYHDTVLTLYDLKHLGAIEDFKKQNKQWISSAEACLSQKIKDINERLEVLDPNAYTEAKVLKKESEDLQKKIKLYKIWLVDFIPEMKTKLAHQVQCNMEQLNSIISAIIIQASIANLKAEGLIQETYKNGFIPGFKYTEQFMVEPPKYWSYVDPLKYSGKSAIDLIGECPECLLVRFNPSLPDNSLRFEAYYKLQDVEVPVLEAYIISGLAQKPGKVPQDRPQLLWMNPPTTEPASIEAQNYGLNLQGQIEVRRSFHSIYRFTQSYGYRKIILDLEGWQQHFVPVLELIHPFKLAPERLLTITVCMHSLTPEIQAKIKRPQSVVVE